MKPESLLMTEIELEAELSQLSYPYRLAVYTDKADFVDAVSDIDKLLELRAFGPAGEFRAYRDVVSVPFKTRKIRSDDIYDGWFDEVHYLDIDDKESDRFDNPRIKKTTGGGCFTLPEEVKEKALIRVRYYYCFDENGIAQKCDWRLVSFEDREVTDNG